MVEPVALAALAIDAALGWPDRIYRRIGHPVGGFARLINRAERRWNDPARAEAVRWWAGIATMATLIVATGAAAFAIERAVAVSFGERAWIVIAVLAWPGIAARSLYEHVRPVERALAAGDAGAARVAVARIVGRDTETLDEAGIARAAIESLSESFCDGVVAPLFWLVAGGLPGLWIYKAINTADSLIGHPEPRWRAFGWAAARSDDLANLVPARLSGLLICLGAARGWRVMWRDCRRHASPNAGWPEAAMAGALGVALAGPVVYDGVWHDKAWIGKGGRPAVARDIRRALFLYLRACLLLAILTGGTAWLRS
ncbi:adenosylcobinamide-phosphate synthase CbiB [Sphingomonas sp.]|uniref:adenosylcobinamide-phosphate synthase CbiB n=1 Tax=Sphingomonas sp. TaxID=28214 RepID=UPI002B9570D0|nr:adenosylcobinamide-phosphate synthase CbiB [Sphingomonas sp.]HTG38755.1 adenosylcobinamide-phosphate synthase CbiB [Sphingomonas sp.]